MIESYEFVLLVLCLWACVATGMAWHFYKRFEMGKFIIMVLGSELQQIAKGELEVKIVGDRVVRTPKEKPNA